MSDIDPPEEPSTSRSMFSYPSNTQPHNPEDDLRDLWRSIRRLPAGQQLLLGGCSGWLSGFVSMKIGKWALWIAGSGFLLVQIASHQGYIRINWREINSSVDDVKRRLKRDIARNQPSSFGEKLESFFRDHSYLAGGFAAGYFLGLGSA